jgi:hypothetical protein
MIVGNKTMDPQTGDIMENPANATLIENFQNLPNYMPPDFKIVDGRWKKLK